MSTNIISLDNSHVYLNLQAQNDSFVNGTTASIFKTFREPILNDPSQWSVSLVKAEIPMSYVPLFDFVTYCQRPLTSLTTPQAELVITFTYLGVDYTSKLTYVSGFAPPDTILEQRFPVYTIDQLLLICNNAFQTAFNLLPAPLQASLGLAPVFVYDPTLRLFGIQFPIGYTSNPLNPAFTGIQTWMNDNLYNFFDTLPYRQYDDTNGSNGYKNNLLFVDQVLTVTGSNIVNRTNVPVSNAPITSPLNNLVWYSMLQEINSIANIYAIASIIFTSNLPTIPEYINTVSANTSFQSQDAIIQFPILSEVSPPPADTEQRLLYIPSAEYRLRDLSSKDPISNIQIQVFYQDKSGLIQPLRIPSKESFTCKLMFRKKSYQNGYLFYLNALPEKEKKRIIEANFGTGY